MTRILLVHGAFHGAWCWDRLLPELHRRQLEARTVDLPFVSAAGDAEVVTEAVERLSEGGEKVMVVGHSFGGAVISRAAAKADHLVYLTAVMVEAGEVPPTGEAPGRAALTFSEEIATVDHSAATAAFYHRCPPGDAEWAVQRLRPMPAALFFAEAPEPPAWNAVASTYIVCTDDQIIHPDAQASMARHAGAVLHLDSDHSPFLACPDLLAEQLAAIADRI